ncbi:long-chain-fatty-acid--CoA ligase [Amylibacter marinus]|uniref:Long-chain-fatty-acid--CoA ligase n=1 Tax=Amylibacter marinus TaxID=1475483 RepID=A0ABQ5VVM8_9RHOB|nr:AMP-binding protein [Amylibacter marinus]GLQ35328.1 long-chain-fatty-acid--CoA ligase [Amylibacter marinus]
MTKENKGQSLDTIPKLLARNAQLFADAPAYREKEFGIWQSWTWAEAEQEITNLALGFLTIGAEKGDHIAIVGRNRPYFYWAIVAAQMIGAVPVPVYKDAVAEEMAYVLDHCSARFVVAEDQEQVDKVVDVMDQIKTLKSIIYLDPRGMRKYDRSALFDFHDLQKQGQATASEKLSELKKRIQEQNSSDTCVMLYTSGTTGRPKGVVLSNQNIVETGRATAEFDGLRSTDSVLAYLPMAWVGDFIFSVAQAYNIGFCVCCPESEETMQEGLVESGPSYFFATPRYFEGLLTSVQIRMEDAGRFKRWAFHTFMGHAKDIGPKLLDGKPVGVVDRLKYRLGRLLVIDPLKNSLGLSRMRVGYTAGEAIGPELFDFYRSLGINLKQLYGQTEASVFITQQKDGEVRADTVGTPSPGVELKITDSGEVFYRSPGSFVCYYNNEKSTKETKDSEGWVATGDAGFIEPESGQLRIIDRAKDVGKMKDGSMFAPKFVENKLKFYANILEAVVLGNGKDTCVAFINIDLNAVGSWAERNNIAYASYQELAAHPEVYQMIQANIEETNRSVATDPFLSGCQIHRFIILHKELDADDGELTRTLKVRRNVIEERYADLINAIYDGSTTVSTETEVTYEDGRKGKISATLEIRNTETFERKQVAA